MSLGKMKTSIATKWKEEIKTMDTAIKGWNYGETEIVGKNLQFKVNGVPAFEIPLSNVSNCSSNKNEAIIEFHGNDDCSVGLVEMRFHIPQPDGAGDEETASELFRQNIMQFADVEMETELPIVLLTGMPCQTPRGRYDIKVFPTFLSFHGKSYDYKILNKSVTRLFLLPHKDNRRMYFVMHINPPIRQGQTRYSYIVFEFVKDEKAEIELNLTEEQLKTQYKNRIEKNLVGYLYEIVVKLFRVFVGIK
uniref:FACT complex subunit SSRP1 n=1 Tax=Panagrolaimus sp. JU765 TaxID=591449 RepID=A0AC34RQ57_9BILA